MWLHGRSNLKSVCSSQELIDATGTVKLAAKFWAIIKIRQSAISRKSATENTLKFCQPIKVIKRVVKGHLINVLLGDGFKNLNQKVI